MFRIIDDGTLDSVFQCQACGKVERYDSETLGRSEDEDMTEILEIVSREHECERENPSPHSFKEQDERSFHHETMERYDHEQVSRMGGYW